MSYGRFHSSGFFFLTIAIAAALTAFLSGAGADELAVPKSKAELKSADDVTASAKAERGPASSAEIKVSYKRGGEAHARVFVVPRELASKLEGGLSGSLEVKSLVLASNGEPRQLIVGESRGGKQVHEIEYQVGWNGSGASCSLIVQASGEGKWSSGDEPRRDIGLPVEEPDCRRYILNPEPTQRVATKQSS